MSILKLTSDTLVGTPATGNIEYNGQFFGTDSNASRAQMQRLVLATSQTASGTSVDFTGIPAWVKKITVMFSGLSTNGTSILLLQLGDSGGIENTGYVGVVNSALGEAASSTAGWSLFRANAATNVYTGAGVITKIDGNSWIFSSNIGNTTNSQSGFTSGSKTLSDVLTQIRITTVNGTDTFDAGSINILYEG